MIDHKAASRWMLGAKPLGRAGILTLSASSVIALFPCVPAAAQTAVNSQDSFENEIIVTAQRRSERLEDVPMSVTALSAESMAAAGVTSLRDISKVVTGVQIAQAGGFTQPAIRGITTLTNGVNFENNVAVYVDGFYEPSSQAINIDLPNVSTIQVLKGPQGTLYGRNATGGAILLNTIDPGETFKGKAELTYGRFDDKRASAYVSGPLSDNIGFSLAGYIRRSDGFVKFASLTTPGEVAGDAAPMKQDAIRAKLVFDLTENLSVKLGYNYTRAFDPRFSYFSAYENVPTARDIPQRPSRIGVVAATFPAELDSKTHQGTLVVSLKTGIGDLKSYTGYAASVLHNAFDFDGSYINTGAGGFSRTSNDQDTFQQAVDFAIDAIDKLDLIVGASFFHDKLSPGSTPKNYGTVSFNGTGQTNLTFAPPLPPFSVMTPASRALVWQDKKAWAVYADATFEVIDKLFVNVGGRYTEERQVITASEECLLGTVTCAATAGLTMLNGIYYRFVPTTKKLSFKQFTPRASLRYEIGERTSIYGSYSKGFRPGAINSALAGLSPTTWLPIEQETVDAFEVGFKTAGRNFRLELAAFLYDFKNLQVSATAQVNNQATTILGNAPRARVKGVEFGFEYFPTEHLAVRGGVAYLHGRYGAFPNAGGTGVNPSTTGLVVSTDPLLNYVNQSQTQDWTGIEMARAPKLTANLGIEYNVPKGEGGFKFNAHASYTSSYVATNPSIWCQPLASNGNCAGIPADVQRMQRFRQPGFALLSASVTWTEPAGRIYVQVYGNNLTDQRYKQHYTGTVAGTYYPMAEPLTYGARLGYKF
jgi:iron complex outermembrane receptor protein